MRKKLLLISLAISIFSSLNIFGMDIIKSIKQEYKKTSNSAVLKRQLNILKNQIPRGLKKETIYTNLVRNIEKKIKKLEKSGAKQTVKPKRPKRRRPAPIKKPKIVRRRKPTPKKKSSTKLSGIKLLKSILDEETSDEEEDRKLLEKILKEDSSDEEEDRKFLKDKRINNSLKKAKKDEVKIIPGSKIKYTLMGEIKKTNKKTGKNTKIYLFQLPCIKQKEEFCAAHSYENAKLLAQKNLNLRETVQELNSEEQRNRIDKRKGTLGCWATNFQIQDQLQQEAEGSIDGYCNYRIKDLHPIQKLDTLPINQTIQNPISKIIAENFRQSSSPVKIFQIGIGGLFEKKLGHALAFRVEKTKNGDIVFFIADSLMDPFQEKFKKVYSQIVDQLILWDMKQFPY